MSLRQIYVLVCALVMSVIVVMAASLILYTSQLDRTARDLVIAAQGVRSAEEVQVQLLSFGRESLLYSLTGDEAHEQSRNSALEKLNEWLSESRRIVDSQGERDAIEDLGTALTKYLSARLQLSGSKIPADQIYVRTRTEFQEAYRLAEDLTTVSLGEAKELQAKADSIKSSAHRVAITICVLAFLMLVLIWRTVSQKVYGPIDALYRAIVNLPKKGEASRAPENGPKEIALIASAFNTMADQLQERREAQLRFLASVAHDLRNPLGAIRMSAEVLGEEDASLEDRQSVVDIISRQAVYLDRMVGDLLDATRVESGHLELQLTTQSVSRLVRDAVVLHRSLSPIHRIELEETRDEIFASCDPVRVGQVLNNLINNAIKYSPHGGLVRVKLIGDGDRAFISVRDSGIGIADSDRDSIFEPFRRTKITKLSIPGVGLGLSVTKKIIEAHKGSIEVESIAGSGSTFTICLPSFAHGYRKAAPPIESLLNQ